MTVKVSLHPTHAMISLEDDRPVTSNPIKLRPRTVIPHAQTTYQVVLFPGDERQVLVPKAGRGFQRLLVLYWWTFSIVGRYQENVRLSYFDSSELYLSPLPMDDPSTSYSATFFPTNGRIHTATVVRVSLGLYNENSTTSLLSHCLLPRSYEL